MASSSRTTARPRPPATTAKRSGARPSTTTPSAVRKSAAKTAATRKAPAGKTAAGEAPAKKAAAKKAPAKKAPAKKAPAKKAPAKKAAVRPPAATKAAKGTADAHYTDPALRERLKRRITAGTKGGRAGQWSARKAQLLARAYEEAGGGYRGGRDERQRHLAEWTGEHWTTADGAAAERGDGTHRYLPEAAWGKLTAAQKRATDRKKVAGSRRGEQFVANTGAARRARKST